MVLDVTILAGNNFSYLKKKDLRKGVWEFQSEMTLNEQNTGKIAIEKKNILWIPNGITEPWNKTHAMKVS